MRNWGLELSHLKKIVASSQGSLGAISGGRDDLFEWHRCDVAGREDTGLIGLTGAIDHYFIPSVEQEQVFHKFRIWCPADFYKKHPRIQSTYLFDSVSALLSLIQHSQSQEFL